MTRPRSLFHPALFVAVARSRVRGRGSAGAAPAVLERLRRPNAPKVAAMHILVVDDDQAVRDSLKRSLEYNGYEVSTAEDGVQALARLAAVRPDAVIMDVMMPRLDGLETTRMLRAAGNDVPILVLTARDAVGDRVDGLDAGGDDYMAKPFALDELLARLRALVRRAGTVADSADPSAHNLTFSDLVLNPQTREVLRGTRAINLTRTEFALLEAFMHHPRRVLERSWLLNEVWGFDFPTTANSLEVYIGYLRRKTEAERRVAADPHRPRGRLRAARDAAVIMLRDRRGETSGGAAVRSGLRSWLRSLPLQRRVAYLTTVAVALAVAVTSVRRLRHPPGLALPRAGQRADRHRELAGRGAGGRGHPHHRRPDRGALRGRATSAWRRSGPTASSSSCPTRRDRLVLGAAGAGRRPARSTAPRPGPGCRPAARSTGSSRCRSPRSRQLRPGARPAAGADQRHPQLAVGGADHLRGDRRGRRRDGRRHRGPLQPAAGAPAGRRRWNTSPPPTS